MNRCIRAIVFPIAIVALISCSSPPADRQWLAGDSHIHSHWSPGYDRTTDPPTPIKGGDAIYSTPTNAQKAREYGLSWMVTTDHGGPGHAKFNLEHAYPELQESRKLVPEVLQFYGMELNMPGMDHHTLIIPYGKMEASMLHEIESRFDALEAWPADPARHTEQAGAQALDYMKRLPLVPIVFANHPSRSAKSIGHFGLDEPRELRSHNDRAPEVYRGMEGAPGHQAATLAPDGAPKVDSKGRPAGYRGSYRSGAPTMGGFDQMTAVVGGVWDAMLGEGRRFWIVATSDSHINFADPARPGVDFWPGQYQKTYVHAVHSYDGILEGLRSGRVFAVAGDLISELDLRVETPGGAASMGGTLRASKGQQVIVTIRLLDPQSPNANGDTPRVARVDLIAGQIRGPSRDPNLASNETAKVIARFTETQWEQIGDTYRIQTQLPPLENSIYIRVRGTSTQDPEPLPDIPGENPWEDLWFYSNPVFIEVPGEDSLRGSRSSDSN